LHGAAVPSGPSELSNLLKLECTGLSDSPALLFGAPQKPQPLVKYEPQIFINAMAQKLIKVYEPQIIYAMNYS